MAEPELSTSSTRGLLGKGSVSPSGGGRQKLHAVRGLRQKEKSTKWWSA